jgi:hypothetical protein
LKEHCGNLSVHQLQTEKSRGKGMKADRLLPLPLAIQQEILPDELFFSRIRKMFSCENFLEILFYTKTKLSLLRLLELIPSSTARS